MTRYPCDRKLYVGDLGNNASKQEIEDAFGYYGPIRCCWVARNPPGFAFVEFEDVRDAEDAARGLGLFHQFFTVFVCATCLLRRHFEIFTKFSYNAYKTTYSLLQVL